MKKTENRETLPSEVTTYGIAKTSDGLYHVVTITLKDGKLSSVEMTAGDNKMENRFLLKEKIALAFFQQE